MLITANIFERVLELRTTVTRGTAFVLDTDRHQYLVSARHLFEQGSVHPVTVSNRFASSNLAITLLPVSPKAADVAVAPLDEPLVDTADLSLPAGFGGFTFSQDLFFLGFPYGLANAPGHPRNRLAFVKKAVLSAAETVDDVTLLYLDGHNNAGFSGGPVVGCPPGRNEHSVCGIVSRFRTEQLEIEGSGTGGTVSVNTGIVVATEIGHAMDAIRRFEDRPVKQADS